jgi:hypothetical protein
LVADSRLRGADAAENESNADPDARALSMGAAKEIRLLDKICG